MYNFFWLDCISLNGWVQLFTPVPKEQVATSLRFRSSFSITQYYNSPPKKLLWNGTQVYSWKQFTMGRSKSRMFTHDDNKSQLSLNMDQVTAERARFLNSLLHYQAWTQFFFSYSRNLTLCKHTFKLKKKTHVSKYPGVICTKYLAKSGMENNITLFIYLFLDTIINLYDNLIKWWESYTTEHLQFEFWKSATTFVDDLPWFTFITNLTWNHKNSISSSLIHDRLCYY